ncbi:hypothetical protein GIY56_01755 [Paracoccus sp. YIM 132242]|uniref:Uncharacterized protein n=1 Tax=Paracoccus lichenicola TaxID=2665644 RepID=A0A6L6HKD8_9RHOB|nr:hypothetical protein [Paracoccus lichenicola]MTD99008.1 hypothetical protein [Paracoccus lichenicola]
MKYRAISVKAFLLLLAAAAPDISVSDTLKWRSLDLSYDLSDGINRIRLERSGEFLKIIEIFDRPCYSPNQTARTVKTLRRDDIRALERKSLLGEAGLFVRLRQNEEAVEEITDCAGNFYRSSISHQVLILTSPREETAVRIYEFIEKFKDDADTESHTAI